MTEEMKFFIYLLEQYAAYSRKSTGTVLKLWDEHQITDEIYNRYWGYHTECLQNALNDIDLLLVNGKNR